jgi:prepilin-type processing-associated H-X9-DG protein
LIELLVVISIVTLLIAVLLLALQATRKQAQRIKCASNLQQIGIAAQLYFNDNNDHIFCRGGTDYVCWFSTLNKYPDNSQLFRCPTGTEEWKFDQSFLYYGCNKVTFPKDDNDAKQFWRVADAASPSSMLLVTDVEKNNCSAYTANRDNPNYPVSSRHANGTNILWLDMHMTGLPTVEVNLAVNYWEDTDHLFLDTLSSKVKTDEIYNFTDCCVYAISDLFRKSRSTYSDSCGYGRV